MDALDYFMLNLGSAADDQCLAYRRVVGDHASNLVCFLPWRTSLSAAKRLGLLPERYLACYELPHAIVSSEPNSCVAALNMIVSDATTLLQSLGKRGHDVTLVGLSMGTAPATFIANETGGRLVSVTSADRGDLMLWQSPASLSVKRKAMSKGYSLQDYSGALKGLHPVDNLRCVRADSIFVISNRDAYVPARRRERLKHAVDTSVGDARIVYTELGHVRTLMTTMQHLKPFLAS